MVEPLPPGATIGILGGGQLGRMLSVAAARLGYRCHIFEPGSDCPAAEVAHAVTTAPFDDRAALERFAQSIDVATYEFENVPTAALDLIEAHVPIHPGRRALATSQDRLDEKTFLAGLGLATAPFAAVDSLPDLEDALATLGTPAILKTRRFGYDGKGQARLTKSDAAAEAFAALKGAPAILEGFINFSSEVSVIAARNLDGAITAFTPGQNVHQDGILRTTRVPSALGPQASRDAEDITAKILTSLDYIGVIGVELFVTAEGLVVNEFAPRVHNSGHWTQNGCLTCQFEQHIRAITGWPLGPTARHADIEMENLIGDDVFRIPEIARTHAAIHLYGKAEARPGRKMGHINRVMGHAR